MVTVMHWNLNCIWIESILIYFLVIIPKIVAVLVIILKIIFFF